MVRLILVVVVSMCILACVAVAQEKPKAEDLPRELAKLNGTWEVTAYTDSGKPADPKGDLRNRRDVFKDGQLTHLYMGQQNELGVLTVKLDPTKSPAEIDMVGKGLKRQGIYKLEKDTLTICFAGKRPTEFESKPGSGIILQVLKRVDKPDIKK